MRIVLVDDVPTNRQLAASNRPHSHGACSPTVDPERSAKTRFPTRLASIEEIPGGCVPL